MRQWKDAWVENGRLLIRRENGCVVEVAKIDDIVRKHLGTYGREDDYGQVRSGDQEGRPEDEGGSG